MKHSRHGAHTKYDLKVHLVWVPKYRKQGLIGEVALRVRDVVRQIASEHELGSPLGQGGQRPRSSAPCRSPAPRSFHDGPVSKGYFFYNAPSGVGALTKEILGETLLGQRILCGPFGNDHR